MFIENNLDNLNQSISYILTNQTLFLYFVKNSYEMSFLGLFGKKKDPNAELRKQMSGSTGAEVSSPVKKKKKKKKK